MSAAKVETTIRVDGIGEVTLVRAEKFSSVRWHSPNGGEGCTMPTPIFDALVGSRCICVDGIDDKCTLHGGV